MTATGIIAQSELNREGIAPFVRRFVVLLVSLVWLMPMVSAAAASEKIGRENSIRERVELVIFWEPGCPYCKRAKAFLRDQHRTRDWLSIREYDVGRCRNGARRSPATFRL